MKGKEPDGGIKVPMKYRATCPLCNARISRMGVFSRKAKCRACGAMLRQNAKWNWIGNGVVSLLMISPLYLAFLEDVSPVADLVQHSWLALSVMVVVLMLVALIVCFILFPYASKYEIDPKHDKSKEKTSV